MARVLIVDDEEIYREQLQMNLALDGHETRTASSGREAIDVGSRFRPEVLIVDWMLRNHIHGLHVSAVLHAILPEIETILITGFSSRDLQREARQNAVFGFVEKPFELDRIRVVVEDAGHTARRGSGRCLFSMVQVDRAGRVLYANPRARDMFGDTRAGRDAASLSDLFRPQAMPDLHVAEHRWMVVSPPAEPAVTWHLRAQKPTSDGGRLVVLRHASSPQYLHLQLVEMLLGCDEPKTIRWPFTGRVLVVDDDELFRRFAVPMLESSGAGCYAVETHAEALRLAEGDEGIRFVLLDYEMPGCRAADLVEPLQRARPDITVVGNSGSDRQAEFAGMGVRRFLFKPWRVTDLIDILR